MSLLKPNKTGKRKNNVFLWSYPQMDNECFCTRDPLLLSLDGQISRVTLKCSLLSSWPPGDPQKKLMIDKCWSCLSVLVSQSLFLSPNLNQREVYNLLSTSFLFSSSYWHIEKRGGGFYRVKMASTLFKVRPFFPFSMNLLLKYVTHNIMLFPVIQHSDLVFIYGSKWSPREV